MNAAVRLRPLVAALLSVVVTGMTAAQTGSMQKIRYGEVLAIDKTIVEVKPPASGAQVGATVGAVAGYALADGRDRWLGALVGGVLGGAGGRAADRAASKKKGWEIILAMEPDGNEIGIKIPGKKQPCEEGDRVRLMTDSAGRTSVKPVKS